MPRSRSALIELDSRDEIRRITERWTAARGELKEKKERRKTAGGRRNRSPETAVRLVSGELSASPVSSATPSLVAVDRKSHIGAERHHTDPEHGESPGVKTIARSSGLAGSARQAIVVGRV